MAEIDDTILDKIRKVQGYLKSDNANEAAVAAAKLTELLIKHNIDLSQIPTEDRVRDPWANVGKRNDGKQAIPEWRIQIAFSIARANLCKMIISYDRKEMHWLGRESNVEVAMFIYDTCTRDLQAIADGLWFAIKDALNSVGETSIHGKTWKQQFLNGAAEGVKQKLAEEIKKWRDENTNVNALIVTNDKELDVFVRSQFPSLGSHTGRTIHGGNAYGLGVTAGKNIQFKQGVGHGGSAGPRRIGSGN